MTITTQVVEGLNMNDDGTAGQERAVPRVEYRITTDAPQPFESHLAFMASRNGEIQLDRIGGRPAFRLSYKLDPSLSDTQIRVLMFKMLEALDKAEIEVRQMPPGVLEVERHQIEARTPVIDPNYHHREPPPYPLDESDINAMIRRNAEREWRARQSEPVPPAPPETVANWAAMEAAFRNEPPF